MKRMKQVWFPAPEKENVDKSVACAAITFSVCCLTLGIIYPDFLLKIMLVNSVVLLSVIVYNLIVSIRIFKKNKVEDSEDTSNR